MWKDVKRRKKYCLCKIMEKMWKVYGKNMEMIWKRCGKDVEKVWTICGKAVYVERLGKGCGQIWKGCGNKFEKGFRKGYWKTAERLRKGCRNCVEMMYTVHCTLYSTSVLYTSYFPCLQSPWNMVEVYSHVFHVRGRA